MAQESSAPAGLLRIRPDNYRDLPPHWWWIEDATGMVITQGAKLVEEARERQARVLLDMVETYNVKHRK